MISRKKTQITVRILRALTSLSGYYPKTITGKELFLNTNTGRVRVLGYNMERPEKMPLYVNLHGGGFVMGKPEMDDLYMEAIAKGAGIKVLSVDYSLSPDVAFPVALNEYYSIVQYAKERSDELGIDPNKIAVGGHSAGGNLSAALCLMDAEKRQLRPTCLILDYPPLDISTDPYLKPRPKGALSPKMSRMFNTAYCQKTEVRNPLVSPIFATADQVKNFPPTLIITATHDSLRDEAEAFGEMLGEANVDVTLRSFEGKHGFTHEKTDTPEIREAWRVMTEYLERYLHA